jgi:hypothetical protein
MRFYSFTNMYLSSIQVGIQTAHCLVDMGREYDNTNQAKLGDKSCIDYIDWADNHKTIVCLNGGNKANLEEIVNFFGSHHNTYPWCCFCEDEDSLNGCLTCVGIIVPEKIYETAKVFRDSGVLSDIAFTEWELQFIDLLNICKLAI